MKATDIMTTEVVTVPDTASARDCVERMLATGHHALPVVDASGSLIGLISQIDILRLCLPQYAEQIGDLAFLPDDFAPFDSQMEKVADVCISDIMTRDPATATEDTAIVFTVDHGQHMGEHGPRYCKSSLLYEEMARRTFMVRLPGAQEGGRRVAGAMAQPMDLLPTVLDLAGVSSPPQAEGKSLGPLREGSRSICETWPSLAAFHPRLTNRPSR